MDGEFGTFSKEVATILDISPHTLRRWSLELEKNGYEFKRNDKNQRIYYERDISALSYFKTLIEKTNNLENTAKAVVAKVKEKNNAQKMLSVITKNDENLTLSKDELQELIQESVEMAISKEREAMFKTFEGKHE
jgi:DNA-binding transcriptional MerR regulator